MVNHSTENCGVFQYGKRLFSRALRSKRYEVHYAEVNTRDEFERWAFQIHPNIIMYNWYPTTMAWLTPPVVGHWRHTSKQLCLYHEADTSTMGFDLVAHQDPTNTDPGFIPISRHLPEYQSYLPLPEIPTFGSFGFGLGGKGFDKLAEKVTAEYEHAILRLSIPYAAFGDNSGEGAKKWVHSCRSKLGTNIRLDISHDFLPESSLLDWLSQNTINCFFYDKHYGRGISGVTDYAISSGRPIAITDSWQFKHLWSINPQVVIGDRTLQAMIDQGTEPLKVFKNLWGGTRVTDDFEKIFDIALGVS